MKVSCLCENLNKGLSIVSRIISTKTSLPILNYILLKTEEGRLKLSATNLEIGINFWVRGKIEKNGEIAVPSRLFFDFISSLPNEKIDLEKKDLVLNCRSSNFESNINSLDASEFPLIPDVKKTKILTIKSEVLKEIISLVDFASAIDDTRPILSGVFLRIKGNELVLAATDSFRLAEKVIKLEKKADKDLEAIIPTKSLLEVKRILSDLDEREVNIYINENQILFETEEVELVSRLIEGTFPNYKQIIPEGFETRIEVKAGDFSSTIRVASLFARESANSIKLKVDKNSITVLATAQVGDNVSKTNAQVEGKGNEITFNSKYISDFLNNIEGKEKIVLEIGSSLSPGVFRKVSDPNYLYLVMPLKA